jgi:predicted acetyltransferase
MATNHPAAVELRPASDDELPEYLRVVFAGFGGFAEDWSIDQERALLPVERTIAAVVDDQFVAGAADYPFDLTVPGGATVRVAGVTGVAVLPTHRRRGILRALMARQLDAVAARGEPIAILNASESSIYERFGYGIAEQYQSIEIDPVRTSFRKPVDDHPTRPIRLVPAEDAVEVVRRVYEAYRLAQPGSLSRSDAWWRAMLGPHQGWKGGGKLFVAVAEPAHGDAGGYVIYELSGEIGSKRLSVREIVAVDPEVGAQLWEYLLGVDLVEVVEARSRPLDDPLRWRLDDPRQVRVTRQSDYLWVRLLDVPAALGARAYRAEASLVLDVTDPFRPAAGGRYRLSASTTGATCARTDDPADLRLDVADLGSLYLAGVRAGVLARAGRVVECTDGAVDVAERLFDWPIGPHCTTYF